MARTRAVRDDPSAADPYDIVFFRRHHDDDEKESEPGREALASWPVSVRAKARAALVAVASAPPHRFAGGGYWEAMRGDMAGWFELRIDGPGRRHYRLFCLLEDAEEVGRPLRLVVIAGLDKPFRTVFSERSYAEIRALGREYRSRWPRCLARM